MGAEGGETESEGGDRGMMSSQVGSGSGPGPVVAGMVLPLGFGAGKDEWRWNDVKYDEHNCVYFGMCVFAVYLDE